MKIMVGCGIYFGFRGVEEHAFVRQSDLVLGKFGPEEVYPDYRFVGIGHLLNDKVQKLSTDEAYVRDTKNIMRVPVLDINDPNDFAGCILRYLEKLEPDQDRMYCYPNKKAKPGCQFPYHKRKVVGKGPVNTMFKDAADIMGLDRANFKGGNSG